MVAYPVQVARDLRNRFYSVTCQTHANERCYVPFEFARCLGYRGSGICRAEYLAGADAKRALWSLTSCSSSMVLHHRGSSCVPVDLGYLVHRDPAPFAESSQCGLNRLLSCCISDLRSSNAFLSPPPSSIMSGKKNSDRRSVYTLRA